MMKPLCQNDECTNVLFFGNEANLMSLNLESINYIKY